MCGRYLFYDELKADIARFFQQGTLLDGFDSSRIATKEVAPGSMALIATQKLQPLVAKWGYPKATGKGLVINGRSETIHTSPYFIERTKSRCIILCAGFYEWSPKKERFYYTNEEPLYLAGLLSKQQEYVILTQAAPEPLKAIHDRCPLVYRKEEALAYLEKADMNILPTQEKTLSIYPG